MRFLIDPEWFMMKITQINFGDLPAQGASDLRQISVSGAPPVE